HDEQYYLTEQGKAHAQPTFLKLASNFRFSFDILARAYRANYTLDSGREGWKAFQEALKCGKRITNPKHISDLNITDENMNDIAVATNWFLDSLTGLLLACEAAAKTHVQGV